ncbi:unnamed protein product [Paramecium sonneborni]|uniref:Protein kinase domain-containing protein n=1 Tax=Paramecium sonneborni TaxID=65129 RepID=A0A8S1RDK5_9CILI|nr:unnamed protein product [Paramecium sonneborni]
MQKKREKFRIETRRNDLERCFKQKREIQESGVIITIGDYCYNSDNLLGKGSYCQVYAGWKYQNKNKKVAIRVMVGNDRVDQEIELQKSLKSKNIARIYDDVKIEDKHYIIMELCDESLSKRYQEFNRKEAIQYFQQILDGLEELEKHNIIHRDLKLDNILLKKKQIKIIDFGFAKNLIDNGLGTESVKCGTPETMAPEVHKCNKRTIYSDKQDVWALGIILHQLFYKIHPFESLECLLENKRRDIQEEEDLVVNDFINKCLTEDDQRMSIKEALQHRIRKYRIALDPDDQKTLFSQIKDCVQNKLESLTHYWYETVRGYLIK